jgi:hypothetical protein
VAFSAKDLDAGDMTYMMLGLVAVIVLPLVIFWLALIGLPELLTGWRVIFHHMNAVAVMNVPIGER